MSDRPTTKDLAESAVDLNGYAVMLKQQVRFNTDKDGNVKLPATKAVAMSEFLEKVVDELLALIPVEEVQDPPG
jgi:hypothetical protein